MENLFLSLKREEEGFLYHKSSGALGLRKLGLNELAYKSGQHDDGTVHSGLQ